MQSLKLRPILKSSSFVFCGSSVVLGMFDADTELCVLFILGKKKKHLKNSTTLEVSTYTVVEVCERRFGVIKVLHGPKKSQIFRL